MNYKYYWLIDAGHGGIDEKGKYTTAPAKMVRYTDGFTIYEGVVNRLIQAYLCKKLAEAGIQYKIIQDPVKDTFLPDRVLRANVEYAKNPNCIFISIHSNAGGGQGNEIYTSVGQTKSDILAAFFTSSYTSMFPDMKFRHDLSDGDLDKEAKFYVLLKTKCPAILVENGFMDNRREAEFLVSQAGQKRYAMAIFHAIMAIESSQPI